MYERGFEMSSLYNALFLARLTGRNVCDVDFQEIISFFNSVWDAKKCVLEQVRSGIHKIKITFCDPELFFKGS